MSPNSVVSVKFKPLRIVLASHENGRFGGEPHANKVCMAQADWPGAEYLPRYGSKEGRHRTSREPNRL